jgi:hypothetical protein
MLRTKKTHEVINPNAARGKSAESIQMTLKNVARTVFGQKRAKMLMILHEIEIWLGGRDSNPDTVVQRAVNVCRRVPFRSDLLWCSRPAQRCAHGCSGVFLRRMSHTVSGICATPYFHHHDLPSCLWGRSGSPLPPASSSGQGFSPVRFAASQSC